MPRILPPNVIRIGSLNVVGPTVFVPPPPPTVTTWNPADKNANLTLSGGNLIATSQTNTTLFPGRGTISKTAADGKVYFECLCSTPSTPFIGLANATWSLANDNFVGIDINGWGFEGFPGSWFSWRNNVAIDSGIAGGVGQTAQVAWDAANGKLWLGINNTWAGGGNPATASIPTYTGVNGPLFPATSPSGSGIVVCSIVANFGASPFTFTPPTGFAAWG